MNSNQTPIPENVSAEQENVQKKKPEPPAAPNPWRDSFDAIIGGLALIFFSLNVGMISYILATIGYLLLFFGFRNLRERNLQLRRAWILASVMLGWHTLWLLLPATPLPIPETVLFAATLFGVAIQAALFWEFRKGLQEVFRLAGSSPNRDPLLGAFILTLLVAAVTYFGMEISGIAAIAVAAFYIFLLHSLSKVGDELAAATDLFIPAAGKIRRGIFCLIYLSFCSLSLLFCCLFFHHLRPDFSVLSETTGREIQDQLAGLGFPEEVVSDLSAEDASVLTGAGFVEFHAEQMIFEEEDNATPSSAGGVSHEWPCLKTTTVFAFFPDDTLYVLEHFSWQQGTAYWQDGFSIQGSGKLTLVSGLLLCDKGGRSHSAPIPRLKYEENTYSDWFGDFYSQEITGAVGYPFGAENQRGYVLYREELPADKLYSHINMHYTHQTSPFRYPYADTEKQIQGGSSPSGQTRQLFTNFALPLSEYPAIP